MEIGGVFLCPFFISQFHNITRIPLSFPIRYIIRYIFFIDVLGYPPAHCTAVFIYIKQQIDTAVFDRKGNGLFFCITVHFCHLRILLCIFLHIHYSNIFFRNAPQLLSGVSQAQLGVTDTVITIYLNRRTNNPHGIADQDVPGIIVIDRCLFLNISRAESVQLHMGNFGFFADINISADDLIAFRIL